MPQTIRRSTPRPRQGGRFARSTPTPARFPGRRPRQQQKSGLLGGLLSGGTASKSSSGSKSGKAGGLAALTAAAGFAFRNRDKLTALLNRRRGGSGPERAAPHT